MSPIDEVGLTVHWLQSTWKGALLVTMTTRKQRKKTNKYNNKKNNDPAQ